MNNTIVKLGIRLFLFCMIAAVALAITNEVTKGPIAAHALASKMAALNTVMPGCEYEEADLGELKEGSELDELFVAKDSSGNVAGYALTASPQGYGGEIPITFGVSSEGYVTQVYVGSLQETAGLGSKVGEAEFKEQFIGIAADKDTLSNDVSTISGATISSSAFMRAASDALEYTEDVLGVVPQAGDKEAILAAFNAANGGDEGGEEAEVTTTAYTFPVKGFDAFNVNIEIDSNGKIASVSIPEHNETAGFGADLIADTAVFEALVGQDAATAQIEVRSGATLTSNAINEALSMAAAELAGGAKEYAVTGFGPFTVAIELDDAGKIVSVTVPSHGETPGLGADLIEDTAVFEALVGQDIASASIDVRAGVTLTSNAINDALAQAAKEFGGDTAPVIPGDPYTVKGMNKFTMYVELDGENIVSVTVPEHNETPGLGADLLTEEALSKLAGMSIKDAKIDIVSGVTLTSNAINNALSMAAMANGFEVAAPAAEPAVEEPAPVEETKDEPAETETAEAPAEETKEEPAETEKAAAPVAAETKTFEVTGFQPFKVDVAVDADGKIASVTIPENGETPGFGADLIADTAVFEALVGKSLEDAQIEVRTGATLTSNAINDALKQAASAFGGAADPAPAEETKEEAADPAPAKAGQSGTYEVTGMNPFKVKVDLDAEGKIIAVEVLEHTETPGLGAELIDNKSVFEALVGQEIAKAAIDVKTGVTLTSNAINDALKQAAAEIAGVDETAAATDTKAYEVTGFAPFKVEIGVDADGKITSITIPENSETPGLGADLIADAAVFEALIGQDIKDAQIDVRAGVTLTSNAINDALKQAAAEIAGVDETAAAADTKAYEVKGFESFKVEIGVDADGKITSITIPENSETPGLGADLIADTAVFEALIGQSIKDAQIDVRAGVTLTSNAINDALKQASEEVGK